MSDTYVLPPGDVVERGIGLDVALEVDVVAFSDVLWVQAPAEDDQRNGND